MMFEMMKDIFLNSLNRFQSICQPKYKLENNIFDHFISFQKNYLENVEVIFTIPNFSVERFLRKSTMTFEQTKSANVTHIIIKVWLTLYIAVIRIF